MRRSRRAGAAGAAAACLALASACSGTEVPAASRRSAAPAPVASRRPTTSTSTTAPATTVAPTTVAPTTTTSPAEAGWSVTSRVAGQPAVEEKTVAVPGGRSVVLVRFVAGRTVFHLHVGSSDPPVTSALPEGTGPAVSAAERPRLLGAFNGGFKTSTDSGGFEVDGVTLRTLVAGEASLVIDDGGRARVAVWGQGAPLPGEAVASVRQNLPPLVVGGQPSTAVNVVSAWGATLGGVAAPARSALGSDAAGNLVYAASSSALPVDLATALIEAGCTTAMELDINPEWVQADVAPLPGAPLVAALPTQSRPATQYLTGWTRDFVTVLAPS